MKKILCIILAAAGLISCNTQKGVSVKGKQIKYESLDEEKLFQAIQKPVDFTTLKIKASADIEAGTSYPSVNMTLYLDKGKQIWANANLILPLARAVVLPEGFKMYERIGKTYVDSNFDYVNNLLKVDFINYQSMENLMIGKLFFPVSPEDFTLSIQENNYILTFTDLMKVGSGKESRNFSRKIMFDSNFNLKQIILEDKSKDTYLQIDYDNYVDVESKILPKNIKIFIKEKKETRISLDYNKFEFVKMDTPFEIPKGYAPRKIN
jgi:predicted small secreted protein